MANLTRISEKPEFAVLVKIPMLDENHQPTQGVDAAIYIKWADVDSPGRAAFMVKITYIFGSSTSLNVFPADGSAYEVYDLKAEHLARIEGNHLLPYELARLNIPTVTLDSAALHEKASAMHEQFERELGTRVVGAAFDDYVARLTTPLEEEVARDFILSRWNRT